MMRTAQYFPKACPRSCHYQFLPMEVYEYEHGKIERASIFWILE